jgi:hypothetical protein
MLTQPKVDPERNDAGAAPVFSSHYPCSITQPEMKQPVVHLCGLTVRRNLGFLDCALKDHTLNVV